MTKAMRNRKIIGFVALALAIACLGCPAARRIQLPKELPSDFIPVVTTGSGFEVVHPLYVPAEYDPEYAWPLIVWLHGAGERGLDGILPANGALAFEVKNHPESFPCLVLFAQAPF